MIWYSQNLIHSLPSWYSFGNGFWLKSVSMDTCSSGILFASRLQWSQSCCFHNIHPLLSYLFRASNRQVIWSNDHLASINEQVPLVWSCSAWWLPVCFLSTITLNLISLPSSCKKEKEKEKKKDEKDKKKEVTAKAVTQPTPPAHFSVPWTQTCHNVYTFKNMFGSLRQLAVSQSCYRKFDCNYRLYRLNSGLGAFLNLCWLFPLQYANVGQRQFKVLWHLCRLYVLRNPCRGCHSPLMSPWYELGQVNLTAKPCLRRPWEEAVSR